MIAVAWPLDEAKGVCVAQRESRMMKDVLDHAEVAKHRCQSQGVIPLLPLGINVSTAFRHERIRVEIPSLARF